jgi:hypothetical protein
MIHTLWIAAIYYHVFGSLLHNLDSGMLVKHTAAAVSCLLWAKAAFLLNEAKPIFSRMAKATCREAVNEKPSIY